MIWTALTAKQKQMAVATVVMAVVLFFLMAYFFGWLTPGSSGSADREELHALQDKLDAARLVLRQADLAQKELDAGVEQLEALKVYTPAASDRYAWAYEYVSRCASQSGVELDSLEEILFLLDAKKPAGKVPYEIRVSLQCDYNRLVEFVWRLEMGNRLLRVKDVEVTKLPDEVRLQQVRLTLQWPATIEIKASHKQGNTPSS